MLVKEATSTNYSIDVSMERFEEICEAENYRNLGSDHVDIGWQLEQLDGVFRVEYDGHFGTAIYLTLDTENDNDETWAKIEAIINP